MSECMKNKSYELTDLTDGSCQYPGIAIGADGISHVCWQEYKNRHDAVYTGWLKNGNVQDKRKVSGEGEALHPVICAFDGMIWYAWSECQDREWQILLRYHKNEAYSPIFTVARGEALFYPQFLTANGRLALVFNEQGRGYSHSILAWLGEDGVKQREIISQAEKTYRPTCCLGNDGYIYAAYDSFNGSRYDILIRVRSDAGWSGEVKINNSEQWASRPIISAGTNGATVCWYEYGDGAEFSYCSTDIRVKNGVAVRGDVKILSANKNWYHDISFY